MTRLISADALHMILVKMKDFGELTAKKAIRVVENAPTVDAVPIFFIEKKIESIRQYLREHDGEEFTSGLISKAIAYEKLIEEWREENGQTY